MKAKTSLALKKNDVNDVNFVKIYFSNELLYKK